MSTHQNVLRENNRTHQSKGRQGRIVGAEKKKLSSQIEEYDLVILGSGAAGKLTAWSLAEQGMKTAVVERKYIGGSCFNMLDMKTRPAIEPFAPEAIYETETL